MTNDKTDLDLFVALYKRFGIDCNITRDEDDDLQIIVFSGNKLQENSYSDTPTYSPKFFGWNYIVTRIIFNLKGEFVSQVFIDDYEEDDEIEDVTPLICPQCVESTTPPVIDQPPSV